MPKRLTQNERPRTRGPGAAKRLAEVRLDRALHLTEHRWWGGAVTTDYPTMVTDDVFQNLADAVGRTVTIDEYDEKVLRGNTLKTASYRLSGEGVSPTTPWERTSK